MPLSNVRLQGADRLLSFDLRVHGWLGEKEFVFSENRGQDGVKIYRVLMLKDCHHVFAVLGIVPRNDELPVIRADNEVAVAERLAVVERLLGWIGGVLNSIVESEVSISPRINEWLTVSNLPDHELPITVFNFVCLASKNQRSAVGGLWKAENFSNRFGAIIRAESSYLIHFICLSLTSGNRPVGCNSLLRAQYEPLN